MITKSELRLICFNVSVALLLVLVTIPIHYLTGLGNWVNTMWFIPLGWWLWYRGAMTGKMSLGMLLIVCVSDFHSLIWQTFWPQADVLNLWLNLGLVMTLGITLRRWMQQPEDSANESGGQIVSHA